MLKVTIIGGGSTYTPELIQGFLDRQDVFPLDELWLMDIDPERLDIVGRFSKRMAAEQGAGFEIILSENQEESIRDASYVITQLRVGQKPQAWVVWPKPCGPYRSFWRLQNPSKLPHPTPYWSILPIPPGWSLRRSTDTCRRSMRLAFVMLL